MINRQLELGLGNAACRTAGRARVGRRSRADWWFAQMRQVVNQAFDWQPAPEPRPIQAWLQQSTEVSMSR